MPWLENISLSNFTLLNQVLYLDISKPFNTTNPPLFKENQSVAIPFGSAFETVLFNQKNIIFTAKTKPLSCVTTFNNKKTLIFYQINIYYCSINY